MKAAASGGGGGGGERGVRSESEKEKTKLRERQRRAITTKIFHGLRKWGGYHLSPRADINEVLRELAKEAGWVVDPDGTTYRARLTPMNHCPACGGATPTTSSSIITGGGGGGGGGECSTTASPRNVSIGGEPVISNKITNPTTSTSPYFSADIPLTLYTYGGARFPQVANSSTGSAHATTTTSSSLYGGGGPAAVTLTMQHQQFYNMKEVKASNQNTPVSSPLHHPI